MKYQVGANIVALNILGPLDLVRADPTAEINSAISHRKWTWGRGLIYIHASDGAIADITSAIGYRGGKGKVL